jgi:hypothetical protein
MNAVRSNPMIFADPFATDELGVGRNMVNSIRYWLTALELAEESKAKVDNKPKPKLELSALGKLIAKHDPFIEEDTTLWVLHYNLASNQARATTWFWLFNKFPMKRFDSQTFINYLSRWISTESTKPVATPSLQKDMACLARTYTKPSSRNQDSSPEDTFESPFSSLGLMDFLENTGSFRMNIGERKIPLAAFGYAVLRFCEKTQAASREVSLQDLTSAAGSPGRAFLLSSDCLLDHLTALQDTYGRKAFSFSRTAGMNLLRVGDQDSTSFLKEALNG